MGRNIHQLTSAFKIHRPVLLSESSSCEQKLFLWRERASRHFVRLIKFNSAANVAAVRNYKRTRLV